MKVKMALAARPPCESYLRLARQLGVTDIVSELPEAEQGPVWEALPLMDLRKRVEDAGLRLSVIESIPISDRVKFGLPGCDEDLDGYCQSIRNVGAAGIPILCYDFMAVFNWVRTSTNTRSRGGALVTSYDHNLMKCAPQIDVGEVTEEQMWKNFEYFLERAIPVAEEAKVKLALHPDDPPISPVQGVPRIMRSVEAFARVIQLASSDYHGITFCQGCFAEMGADVPAVIRSFGERGQVFFAHFRNVRGTVPTFEEAFHDDGDIDMAAAMRAYRDIGFEGPMRPDHVPTLEGESNDDPGYTTLGRLHAVGYMKGLIDAIASNA